MKRMRIFFAFAVLVACPIWTCLARGQDGGSPLTLSPTSFSFTAVAGSTTPVSELLSVSATRQISFTASASGTSGGITWLSVSPTGTLTTSRKLTVIANPSGLAAGTYSGHITIRSGEESYTRVPVTLTVGAGRTLNVSPASLSFSATAGGTSPLAQSLTVTASPNTTYTASVSGAPWLTVSPASGTTPATLTVSSSVSGLAAGTFSGTITITGNGVTHSIPVSFTVTAAPTFNVSPGSLSFSATAGGTSPLSQSLSLTASPNTTYTASVSGAPWLTVSPASGTTPATLTVSSSVSGLAAGTFSGAITVTGNGVTHSIPVSFTVTAAPTFNVSPGSLSFSATAGGTSPLSQSLSLTASPNTTFTASVSGAPWLTVSPASGTTPATLTVSSSVSGLAAGTFSGAITVTGNGVTHSIPVSFTVTAAPTFNVSPGSLSFSATAGGTSPLSQSLSLTASPNTTFTASVSGAPWLTVSPASGTTPATLTVSSSVSGLAAGTFSGTITVTGNGLTTTVPVSFTVNPSSTFTVSPASLSFSATAGGTSPASQTLSLTASPNTTFTASVSGAPWLTVSPATGTTPATLTVSSSVTGLAAGTFTGTITLTGNGITNTVLVAFNVGATASGGPFKLVGWNDLGMHCDDGKDFSVAAFLPPFNDIHAHLIDTSGSLVTTPGGYTITYEAITDPLTSTLNTTSIGKTNFWDYVMLLNFFTMPVVNPVPDEGLAGSLMPGLSNTPRPMTFSTTDNTWEALGVPMTNYADNGTTNYYPMMRLTATNSSGAVLATTDIVLPISDEVGCAKCHASGSNTAAMPAAGWVNNSDPSKDMKLNILRLHDDRFKSSALFQSAATQVGYNPAGLEATTATRPVLCYQCHANAFTGMGGVAGIPAFTTAIHGLHASVIDPATAATMDSGTTRATCYSCHPGPTTRCLRGAMGNLLTTAGTNAIECQSCHGNMTALASTARTGWFNEPNCQSCHTGLASATNTTLAYTSAFSSGTTLRTPADATFATTPNTPATGQSLFRLSSGHGGLQCEACHGSTHAELPTNVVNDNVQSIAMQGHAGMLAECSACHATVPTTTNGGPHGLHPIGTTWVSRHQSVADSGGTTACQGCHGTNYMGTVLSRVQTDRTLAGKTFAAGTMIGCYSCHNGPGGG